jgi:hypothetical protein
MKKMALLLVTLALSAASAKTFDVTLYQPSVVAGSELQPGAYKLDLNGTRMVLRNGGTSVACDVKVEINERKYTSGSVRYEQNSGKSIVREIRLRGTDMKLMLAEPVTSSAGSL